FTYGLADLRNNQRVFDQKYELPADPDLGQESVAPAVEHQQSSYLKDFRHYLQDDFRLGGRASAIAGVQLLRRRDQGVERLLTWQQSPAVVPPRVQNIPSQQTHEQDWLPYLVFAYPLDAQNLVRALGNESVLRVSEPLLAPSEAFIVGEPITIYFTAG